MIANLVESLPRFLRHEKAVVGSAPTFFRANKQNLVILYNCFAPPKGGGDGTQPRKLFAASVPGIGCAPGKYSRVSITRREHLHHFLRIAFPKLRDASNLRSQNFSNLFTVSKQTVFYGLKISCATKRRRFPALEGFFTLHNSKNLL